MRQISATIDERLWLGEFRQRQLAAWQTRTMVAWMVKLTPDLEKDMADKLIEEANGIHLDGVNPGKAAGSKPSDGKPTKKDFYDMTDAEIEQHLGNSDNRNGSFEQLMAGFGRS